MTGVSRAGHAGLDWLNEVEKLDSTSIDNGGVSRRRGERGEEEEGR